MQRLTNDILVPQIEEIIRSSGILDDYTYEVTPALLMANEQGLVMGPNLQLVLAVPHPVDIGQKLTVATNIPGFFPESGLLDVAILTLVNSLAEQRQAALSEGSKLITP